jgi:putative hydrolase of the HAD superfamily
MMLSMIALDADDTLWHNETHYLEANTKLKQLLKSYQSPERIAQKLGEMETRNIRHYGYGIKSYTLSMIEAAIELTDGQIHGSEIRKIIELGQEMLSAEVALFEHTEETLANLASHHDLMLITKGDLLEQGSKIDRSGLKKYFRHVEIVQDKTAEDYRRLLERYGISPDQFLMVGNSLKSDILPVIEIGGRAVYIPYQHTWAHENAVEGETPGHRYYEIAHLGQLSELIAELDQ